LACRGVDGRARGNIRALSAIKVTPSPMEIPERGMCQPKLRWILDLVGNLKCLTEYALRVVAFASERRLKRVGQDCSRIRT
jgi:hypothetical protein